MKPRIGRCPVCDSEGTIGSPCDEKGCRRRGYHFLPQEYLDRIRAIPARADEPWIGRRIEEYLVADVLGAGGFGKVYLALQMPIGMRAALKLMERGRADPVLAQTLARRFEGEAEALAALSHPNAVKLLKYGVTGDLPYLVMELLEGRTLAQEVVGLVMQGAEFELGAVFHVLGQVLAALEAAHNLGIVHRDVKFENVMLQEVLRDRYFVKVMDFGLAKFVEEHPDTSMILGTPVCMAPEQLTRRNIGPWTDLYAVGVMAFELLTGRRPFTGRSTQEIIARKLDPTYDPTSRLADLDIPQVILEFFRRALAFDPAKRFRSAPELAEALVQVRMELERTDRISVASGDLSDLLDSSELQKVRLEKQRIEEERKAVEEERRRLVEERRAFEEDRRRAREDDARAVPLPVAVPPIHRTERDPVDTGTDGERPESEPVRFSNPDSTERVPSMVEPDSNPGDASAVGPYEPEIRESVLSISGTPAGHSDASSPPTTVRRARWHVPAAILASSLATAGLFVLFAPDTKTEPPQPELFVLPAGTGVESPAPPNPVVRADEPSVTVTGSTGPSPVPHDPAPPAEVAHVTLTSVPPGARVLRADDRVEIGRTPQVVAVRPGMPSRLVLKARGFQDQTVDVTFSSALAEPNLTVVMKRRRASDPRDSW